MKESQLNLSAIFVAILIGDVIVEIIFDREAKNVLRAAFYQGGALLIVALNRFLGPKS